MCTHLPELIKPPLLSGGSEAQKRQQIRAYFQQTWELYESLFSLINADEAYFLRPEPLRHPLIFYYGHTAVFYINKLILGKYISNRIAPHLESICAVGVDEMSWDDLKPGNYKWPSVQEVREYRDTVKQKIINIIEEMPLTLPIQQDSLAWIVLMGIEHERIHIETSSVIMRMMDTKFLTPNERWLACSDSGVQPDNQLVPVAGQEVVLGKPTSNDTYGWDNEYGEMHTSVDDFKVSQYLVSNGEFMQFIEAGGYETPAFWTEEGQNWLSFTKAKMPRFWTYRDGEYWQRNLLQEMPLPMDWPVEVNYLEAKAFCNWKSSQTEGFIRLPTETEWQILRDKIETDLPYWRQAPGNINLEHFASSCPVTRFNTDGIFDVIGNVWQWTESPIDGFDGFQVHPLYDDFSTPTFDGKHNLIKGGSWISTGNEATRDSRYAFRRHFFQHAGFRYVQSDSPDAPITPVNQYETQVEISQLLFQHFGQDSIPDDMAAISELVRQYAPQAKKALDIGCGTGRLSYELAKTITSVDGIDFTARHIQHALHLKEGGVLRYAFNEEGDIQSFHETSLACLGLSEWANNVRFVQGDGHNLKPQFSGYDVIVCHKVLDSVYDPKLFIHTLVERLNEQGILILSGAWQWENEKTEQRKRLGGFKQDGENVSNLDGLEDCLCDKMTLLNTSAVQSVLKLNARRAIVDDCDVQVWQKM